MVNSDDIRDNLIIYVSSKNNYDMLEKEVIPNLKFDGCEFINVDDNSAHHEKEKGKKICEENNIIFLENKSKGVQMATQTLIDFINKNRPECKWIMCFQHDIIPITKGFVHKFSDMIKTGNLDEIGSAGFNVLDKGKYCKDLYQKWRIGHHDVLGMVGLAHLSVMDRKKRWMGVRHGEMHKDFQKPFAVEIPQWTTYAINVKLWNKCIKPTDSYAFHLWAPDIAFQFLKNNIYNITIPELYLLNQQELKAKYNIAVNSAHGAKNGDEFHFGFYHQAHVYFKNKWGWDYDHTSTTLENAIPLHKGTLIEEFFNHNIEEGPLKTFEI